MAKQIFTNAQIEKDIITALKNPPDMPKKEYKNFSPLVALVIAILLVVSLFIYPPVALGTVIAMLVFLLIAFIYSRYKLKKSIRDVSINDYIVTTETVSHTEQEKYVRKRRYGGEVVCNYNLYFQNGKAWRIPKDNYLWSEERPMSDLAIFDSAHCGDTFVVVAKKDSGRIIVAYSTEFFKYEQK